MDFDDTPQEAAFRAEARSWLEAHAKEKSGEMKLSLHHDPSPEADAESVRRSKEWQRTLYDGGWAGITWPVEYGGRGGTPVQQMIFDQEQARFDVSAGAFAVGIGMVGPTLIARRHGGAEEAVPRAPAARRRGVVPALQRAGRRFGPGRAQHPGGA